MLLPFILLALCGWGGLVLPLGMAVYGLVKWRGRWRVAASVPLAVLVLFFAPLLADWQHDPTAHNLWGLVFIPVGLVLFVYTTVVLVLRWRVARH
jgi:hypothetical protein